ncbi:MULTISPECIES: Sec-independent protein translocase subunit TatA/TatB [Olivibacter]|jgi:sec-independent protein translocase protein TatA|uniref:Sec-independent protein translocase protein TatA n=3 Tax=Sphingobacteriaceae TaxID=84566 RepID=F4CDH9_SPHS2|nr:MULTISPECIES: twin-arginine translocase TatA/TatE family subunit [Olivibacter]MCL4641445.1 twin-arginine translocase TatA/TatE family subunit [Olivibacter sp. UJ_SKK_5.1]MDM8177295.1 twin-arginine translocase TatA/TatE family subunit [Olivibacter sp. 47]MDX3912004.1 twin-arginine translocase TatA/TatE family subunit [Pseudosphingobacterium sp.]QEK99745.1 twin-arginine translocase TatA/TatE family subunit [Olivibacter sp. LS-1]
MLNTILLLGIGGPEIAIIVLALLLLFGGKKIPELMRGLGRGVREFKEGQAGTTKDEVKEEKQ